MLKAPIQVSRFFSSHARVPTVPPATLRQRRTIFLAGASAAFAVFLTLLALVRSNHRLNADVTTTLRLQRRQHPLLTRVMNNVSWLGFRPQSLLLPASMIALTRFLGFRRDARFLLIAWGASFVSFSTKRLVRRPRPDGPDIQVVEADLRDSSFPSGHVLHYVVFWGFVTYLWYTRPAGRWLRCGPVATMLGLIGMVGPSRIYLGHHWLTDVLASYSLGTGILLSLIGLRQRDRKNRS
ncbi:MAG: phosphatase PAP2 family protein [Chloroflexota bacterium]